MKIRCTVDGCGKEFDAPEELLELCKPEYNGGLTVGPACPDCTAEACGCSEEMPIIH